MRYFIFIVSILSFSACASEQYLQASNISLYPSSWTPDSDTVYSCSFNDFIVLQDMGKNVYLVHKPYARGYLVIVLHTKRQLFEGKKIPNMQCVYIGVTRYKSVIGGTRQALMIVEKNKTLI